MTAVRRFGHLTGMRNSQTGEESSAEGSLVVYTHHMTGLQTWHTPCRRVTVIAASVGGDETSRHHVELSDKE